MFSLKDMVSQKTLLKLLPFVEDPDFEIEEVQKKADENIKRQQALFNSNQNNPPDREMDLDADDEESMTGRKDEKPAEEKKE